MVELLSFYMEGSIMLEPDILEKVVYFSNEEIDHLNGKNMIDKSIYCTEISNTVDYHKLILDDSEISIRKHTRFLEYPNHKHNYIELIYVYSGSITHIIDHRKIVIHEGEILILNQNVEHSILYTDENDIVFNFIIKPSFFTYLSSLIENNNEVTHFILESVYPSHYQSGYIVFKSADNVTIKSYIESIITVLYKPSLNTLLEIKMLVGLLICELMNRPEAIEAVTEEDFDKKILTSIFKYISLSYKEGSLTKLSSTLKIEDYKICKIIREATGMTFKELIQRERVKEAKRQLKFSQLSIEEIMYAVGYNNTTYFYKIFKEHTDLTPNQYRKQESLSSR